MDRPSVEDRLRELTSLEATVLYWLCQGENDDEIGNNTATSKARVDYAKETVRNYRLSAFGTMRPYRFENTQDRILIRTAIQKMAGSPPRFSPWPPVEPSPVAGTPPQETPSPDPQPAPQPDNVTWDTLAPPTTVQPAASRTRRTTSPLLLLFAGILLVGLILVILALRGDNPFNANIELPTRPTEIVEATEIAEVIPEATIPPATTIAPSAIPEATEVVDIASAPTIDATGTAMREIATANAILTQTAPTNTPMPTDTPTMTPTSTPTIVPGTVLFEDDFSDGKSDQWVIESGEPFVVNEAITGTGLWTMSVGDLNWTNYEVSFDYSGLGCDRSNFAVGMRAQDVGNMIRLTWCGNLHGWQIYENGQIQQVPNTGFTRQPSVRITVVGNEYSVVGGSSFVDEENLYPTGKVILFVGEGLIIDNFKITALP